MPTSSPHNQKQLCNLRTFTSTKRHQQLNTLQVHAKGNELNHNGYRHARYTLKIARQLSYIYAESKPMPLSLNKLKDKSKVSGDFLHDFR